jgi:hypothetical protein
MNGLNNGIGGINNGVNIYGLYGTSSSSSSASSSGSSAVTGVSTNGGLILASGSLGIKVDPNINNTLSLTTSGILSNGLKTDGSNSMTGNLNAGTNILVGNLTGAPNLSAIVIKQTGVLSISDPTSRSGIKLYNSTNNDAFYFGISGSSAFSLFSQTTGGVYREVLTAYQAGNIQIYQPLNMSNFQINNLLPPTLSNDAVNKSYVDGKIIKNQNGFIPALYNDGFNKSGFSVSTNSSYSPTFAAFNAFNPIDATEWVTAGLQANCVLLVILPFPIRIWQVALRGRNAGSERWFDWRIEASNDGALYTTLFTATGILLGNIIQYFNISDVTNYNYIRFFGVNGELTNPGLSVMQLYSVDTLI